MIVTLDVKQLDLIISILDIENQGWDDLIIMFTYLLKYCYDNNILNVSVVDGLLEEDK